jgi:hypothetical protein
MRITNGASERGFTLVEVMASLVIIMGAAIPMLVTMGQITDDVIVTVEQRKMRYLIQNILGDLEKGKFLPESEEEVGYEEGMIGDFNDFASDFNPSEYQWFEWSIPVFRDEIIIGGADEETLLEQGFERGENGSIQGRPVSSDPAYSQGLEGTEGEGATTPPGQIKRVLVFVVRRLGEVAEDDREFVLMTYLPYPGEEQQQLGGEGGEGEGGPGEGGAAGADGAAGAGDVPRGAAAATGGGSDKR